MDTFSLSLIKYLTLQLEYNLLEKRIYTFLQSKIDDSNIVELESLYVDAHWIELRAKEADCMSNLAYRAKIIRDIIKETVCKGSKCYFNF